MATYTPSVTFQLFKHELLHNKCVFLGHKKNVILDIFFSLNWIGEYVRRLIETPFLFVRHCRHFPVWFLDMRHFILHFIWSIPLRSIDEFSNIVFTMRIEWNCFNFEWIPFDFNMYYYQFEFNWKENIKRSNLQRTGNCSNSFVISSIFCIEKKKNPETILILANIVINQFRLNHHNHTEKYVCPYIIFGVA